MQLFIASLQVKFILGIKMPRADTIQKNITLISENIDGFQWVTFVMGMGLLFIIYAFTYVGRWINKCVDADCVMICPCYECTLGICKSELMQWIRYLSKEMCARHHLGYLFAILYIVPLHLLCAGSLVLRCPCNRPLSCHPDVLQRLRSCPPHKCIH
jgi:MFS superfamily sulfate permease-like transporter